MQNLAKAASQNVDRLLLPFFVLLHKLQTWSKQLKKFAHISRLWNENTMDTRSRISTALAGLRFRAKSPPQSAIT
jgi:hypothetical protein